MIRLPSPAEVGTTVLLRVTATDGRRGGALLDGPVELEVTEAQVSPVPWEDGAATLAGYLDDASPSGVYAGQVRTGLLGPVVLRLHS